MPYDCQNVVRIQHEDPRFLDRVEEICNFIIWARAQSDGTDIQPPPHLAAASDYLDKDESEYEYGDLALGVFDEVDEISDFKRDTNGIECRFYTRKWVPEMLYRELGDFGYVVNATMLHYEGCGLYEKGEWQFFDLEGPQRPPEIPERIIADYGPLTDASDEGERSE